MFREFQERFSGFPVISVLEIEKAFPGFDRNAITRWQKKGYLTKIRRGHYRLKSTPVVGDGDLFLIANRIYHPSYVSLQSAMRWHGFIPEGVFTVTSVSTKKTVFFQTPVAPFQYRNLKKELFFGYSLEKTNGQYFKIAEPEKAILDFLYLQANISTEKDLSELRFNIFELKEKIDLNKLESYLSLYSSKALAKRTHIFKKYLVGHDVVK